MPPPWPASGLATLARDANGWLLPTPDYLRHLLARPEMALLPESCRAERALHRALHADPCRAVAPATVQALKDPDARANFRHWLAVRDALLSAGSLQGWYLALMRSGRISVPPLFIDLVVQAIVQHLLAGTADALAWRATELFFRPQRITLEQGRVLAADSETLQHQRETRGLGEIGRLLAQAQAPVKGLDLRVLTAAEAPRYFAEAALPGLRSSLLLDLTLQDSVDTGQGAGLSVPGGAGLHALAGLLSMWVRHLLGVAVTMQPLQKIEDERWRWHVGLDAESNALLNDLYEGRDVEPARSQRLVSLFRLRFDDPAEMRRDTAGRPVYLGLMAAADGSLRMKPQNLLLNLPLADPAA